MKGGAAAVFIPRRPFLSVEPDRVPSSADETGRTAVRAKSMGTDRRPGPSDTSPTPATPVPALRNQPGPAMRIDGGDLAPGSSDLADGSGQEGEPGKMTDSDRL